jgi:hypothetical protein
MRLHCWKVEQNRPPLFAAWQRLAHDGNSSFPASRVENNAVGISQIMPLHVSKPA